jgi:dolichol-phosphate mannosyltransferase
VRSLVIIPTYNERENLPRLVPAVLEKNDSLDVLVVDDGSPDGTGEVAESLARKSDCVRVMHRSTKQGLGTAYVAGFRYALDQGYDRIVQMDADFSHRPEDLPRLLKATEFADVVVGSRNVPGGRVEDWSLLRRFVSKGGSLYSRMLLGLPVKDCTSGFKCFRRRVLETVDFAGVASNGYGFQVEMNHLCHRARFAIAEVPIVFPDRTAGESKMSWPIFWEAAGLVWKLRRQRDTSAPAAAQRAAKPSLASAYATERRLRVPD